MIDLHQGMTGEELREMKPGLGQVAMAQLDTVSSFLRGDLKAAARKQAGTWMLLGKTVLARLRPRQR